MDSVCTYTRGNGPKAARRHKGLSIIEVAMASALLIVAMVPILRSLTKANMFASEIERKTRSLVLAQGNLDKIKAFSIYNFDSLGSFLPESDGSYLCNIAVEATANPDLKKITVEAGYDDEGVGHGTLSPDEVDVTLATYVARRW